MTACPECHCESAVESEWNDRMSDVDRIIMDYICENCGCEWTETTLTQITKHGKTLDASDMEECEVGEVP